MKFTIYQNSLQGPRQYNQDRLAYSYSKDALLLVVADGMGGHRHGEIAAQLAVTTMTDAFQRLAVPTLSSPAKFLIEHIQQVHDMIDQLTQEREMLESPRTTIVAAVVQRGVLYCAHVGDSRLYHFRDGHLLYRTEDHSIVQSLYSKGIINKDDMSTHPYRHKVYSCLGGDIPPKIDLSDRQELAEGDTILLCTDGVWGAVADGQIKHILNRPSITDGITALLNKAESASQEQGDNMSAIGLQWGDKQSSNLAVSTISMAMGTTTTIMNPITNPNQQNQPDGATDIDLTDDEIESTIEAIQQALLKTKRK
ncbi:PP2C family serine/threonine-protein phosphatase [Methylotenera sp.]|uniref:PP2C family protein-serine/threonine phosphatase n=2 Tax=Methylotenera sp. TaxID=2051956 RepID=UPI002721435A|nr:protein phosphatase 2C domain-containing protein [Methylotenera sp.]MDO9205280.1 protein phosphatase 2C domain-containing protein [Methylotenera sp.]MDP1522919.1 protein phosphatase 2C domain-containing protein [Methylotenera sp.]MDP2072384.1 protein phosphatase 2C domain-containing protein [Methylotenera sp.]MDP3005627.1 protein phosphatase 2C domain-containing protein [Methylotenera sp.]MDP3817838.1 protein phosphatase 2C domain-containing protein [Methylotenera sp.]